MKLKVLWGIVRAERRHNLGNVTIYPSLPHLDRLIDYSKASRKCSTIKIEEGEGEGTRVRLTERKRTAHAWWTGHKFKSNCQPCHSRFPLTGKDPLIGSLFSRGEIMKEENMEIWLENFSLSCFLSCWLKKKYCDHRFRNSKFCFRIKRERKEKNGLQN